MWLKNMKCEYLIDVLIDRCHEDSSQDFSENVSLVIASTIDVGKNVTKSQNFESF
jgi:hypothetical protein